MATKKTGKQAEPMTEEAAAARGWETLTLERAKRLTWRDTLYQKDDHNSDGSPTRWRVNGAPKTWKRTPERVQVPIKHGLYSHDYVTEGNLHRLWVAKESEG